MAIPAMFTMASANCVATHTLAIGWDWWLPPNYAVHGRAIDQLFIAIFWLTMFIFVAVESVLIYFMVKYRHRGDAKKGVYTHGHLLLEVVWTIIPAVILVVLALVTKGVWENYRYAPQINRNDAAKILVIGQQFKWNVVYPGPDGKLGRYLIFPKPTDLKWPQVPPGKSFEFPNVPGPAYLKEEEARRLLNKYIDEINPLGKDFSDPAGEDDNWQDALARTLELPKDYPVEIHLGSKDVIHDFFLPDFRVKLDAVPGMRGLLYLTATRSSAELEKQTRHQYTLAELEALVKDPKIEVHIAIEAGSPQVAQDSTGLLYKYPGKHGGTIIRNEAQITSELDPDTNKTVFAELKEIGVETVVAYQPKFWELVCEELCGQGHYTMQDRVVVLEKDAYMQKWGPKPKMASAGASKAPGDEPAIVSVGTAR